MYHFIRYVILGGQQSTLIYQMRIHNNQYDVNLK